MSSSDLFLLIFLPCCFLGRVDVIGEPRIAAYVKPQKTGSQEQNESETKATDAPKQFEIEEIGKSEENETQNVLTNGSQMVFPSPLTTGPLVSPKVKSVCL